MDFKEIEEGLRRTFDDAKLSQGEKSALTDVIADFHGDEEKIRFIRNRAFDIISETITGHDDEIALTWLEDIIRLLDKQRTAARPGKSVAHFSPGSACLDAIRNAIASSRKEVDICVYTITDNRIGRAIAQAMARGVKFRLITDDEKLYDAGSDVMEMVHAGIPTKVDTSDERMHHKFAIFDKKEFISGSYNWTRSAADSNYENVVVTDDETLIASFSKEFDRLWGMLPDFHG
jgi:cardiolipin hydrolase